MDIQKVLRQEKKYMLSAQHALRLEGNLQRTIEADGHNGEEGYMVRSLYFDTLMNRDYEEKLAGTEVRRKMRIRIYSPEDEFAFLEIKQKQGAYQLKRSMKISRKHASRLAQGDYSVLEEYEEPFAWEFYGILRMNTYLPRTIVEYRRKAYVLPENSIRITFDSQITATESSRDLFDKELLTCPVLEPWKTVLEVKYDGFLLSYVKEILEAANKSEAAVSKYCMARAVTYHNLYRI